jgi:hypothetical protein
MPDDARTATAAASAVESAAATTEAVSATAASAEPPLLPLIPVAAATGTSRCRGARLATGAQAGLPGVAPFDHHEPLGTGVPVVDELLAPTTAASGDHDPVLQVRQAESHVGCSTTPTGPSTVVPVEPACAADGDEERRPGRKVERTFHRGAVGPQAPLPCAGRPDDGDVNRSCCGRHQEGLDGAGVLEEERARSAIGGDVGNIVALLLLEQRFSRSGAVRTGLG